MVRYQEPSSKFFILKLTLLLITTIFKKKIVKGHQFYSMDTTISYKAESYDKNAFLYI